MKKYDSIFIKRREMNSSEYLEVDGCGLDEIEGPVIVLSEKELREIYNIGRETGHFAAQYGNTGAFARDLDEYLQQNGIQL